MALFQKRPQTSAAAPLYTLGLNKTLLVVGLGNVGPEYDGTRHNLGFSCLDSFVDSQELGSWTNKKDLKALEASGTVGQCRVIALKPTTFMNNSGEAVQAAMQFYKIPAEQVLVIHDELDVPFGQIRCRVGGSSAGHNGIKSVSEHIGENYGRVRIGIGPKQPEQMDSADFVLATLTSAEQDQLPSLYKEVNAILSEYVFGTQALPHETRNFIV